jgi:hypothetical protein
VTVREPSATALFQQPDSCLYWIFNLRTPTEACA